ARRRRKRRGNEPQRHRGHRDKTTQRKTESRKHERTKRMKKTEKSFPWRLESLCKTLCCFVSCFSSFRVFVILSFSVFFPLCPLCLCGSLLGTGLRPSRPPSFRAPAPAGS